MPPATDLGATLRAWRDRLSPTVGSATVDWDVLTDGDAEPKIVILTAAPDSEDESRLQLALVAGVPEPVGG